MRGAAQRGKQGCTIMGRDTGPHESYGRHDYDQPVTLGKGSSCGNGDSGPAGANATSCSDSARAPVVHGDRAVAERLRRE